MRLIYVIKIAAYLDCTSEHWSRDRSWGTMSRAMEFDSQEHAVEYIKSNLDCFEGESISIIPIYKINKPYRG
jgi:hypothetical protein